MDDSSDVLDRVTDSISGGQDDHVFHFGIEVSEGVARSPGDGAGPQDLTARADVAMYGTARTGKGPYALAVAR